MRKKTETKDSNEIDDWAERITRSLINESDRGCILIGVSLLDERLIEHLHLALRRDSSLKKKFISPLFKASGPLHSFAHRINIAFALGMISPDARDDLHSLRKLRNEVAHLYGPTSFRDSRIRGIIRSLNIAPTLLSDSKFKDTVSEHILHENPELRKEQLQDRLAFMLALSYFCGRMKASGRIYDRHLLPARSHVEKLLDRATGK